MHQETSQSKAIDISTSNIEISQIRPLETRNLLEENKAITKLNLHLKKELEQLSNRLDVEIIKRITIQKKKENSETTHMQLQNAYKKYQIYKKQASLYRRKFQSLNEETKFQDLQMRVFLYEKENFKLKEEMKQLKKMLKKQQKGLAEIGIEGYPSIVSQNQKLKEEVRFLKKELDNYRRNIQLLKKVKLNRSQIDDKASQSAEQHKKSLIMKNKEKTRQKLKFQQEKSKHQEDQGALLREKTEKDLQKIKSLYSQKKKLRQFVQNLKSQLVEKQKENEYLREKINQLRKNNQLLQSQSIVKRPTQNLKASKVKKDKTKSKRVHSQLSEFSNMKVRSNKPSEIANIRIWKKSKNSDFEIGQNSRNDGYPQKYMQNKNTPNNVIKWNHQHLSSKIKQLDILQHQNGHIKDLRPRYEKGSPKQYHRMEPNTKYKVFNCSQYQYIKNVEGAFAYGYLQYLIVTSNYNRVEKYGNFMEYEQPSKGEHFEFQVGEGQFPGALFGQNDEKGVRKLGCFIHRQN